MNVLKILAIVTTDVKTLISGVMIMMHVLLTPVIARKVANMKRFLVTITMHVPMTTVTRTLDVPTPKLTAMITMLVLPIAVILPLDATTNQ
jgi:hypothetical protein